MESTAIARKRRSSRKATRASASDDMPTRILRAALESFAKHGFAATTTAEIARRAGCAEKTLFFHFKSKRELFQRTLTPATLELVIPEVTAKLDLLLDGSWDDIEEFCVAVMKNRFEVFRERPAEFKLILQEMLLHPELARPFREKFRCRIQPHVDETLGRLKREGELEDLSPTTIRRVIASTLIGYAVARFILDPQTKRDDDEEIRLMARILANGLRPRAGTRKRGR